MVACLRRASWRSPRRDCGRTGWSSFFAHVQFHNNTSAGHSAALLKANLTQEQREQYEGSGYFDVIGGTSGKCYRIWRGFQMNVQLLDNNGKHLHWLCFTPQGHLPVSDVVLAQKIALEVFEEGVIRIANRMSAQYRR